MASWLTFPNAIKRHHEVEIVRQFTSRNHPFLGLIALLICRIPVLATVLFVIARHSLF